MYLHTHVLLVTIKFIYIPYLLLSVTAGNYGV